MSPFPTETAKLAFRNLGRNARRTLITGLALSLSTALFIAYYAIVDGMNSQLVHSLTRFDLGHLQVHAPDWLATHSLTKAIDDGDAVLGVVRRDPEVRAASPRVYAPALVGAGKHSTGVELIGVEPRSERQVTELERQITSGEFLSDAPTPWPAPRQLTAKERAEDAEITREETEQAEAEIDALVGLDRNDTKESAAPTPGKADVTVPSSPADSKATGPSLGRQDRRARKLASVVSPKPERPPRVVLGSALARVLGLKVGDELFASTQSVDGTAEGVRLEVGGIFETGTLLYDRTRIYMHIADLQHLTHLGGRIHEIAAVLDSPDEADAVANRLSGELSGLDVESWSELRPDMVRLLDLNRGSSAFLALIVLFVAALGVVNTMLMAVHERMRELGVLKAIGMSGLRVFSMIAMETVLLAIAAGLVGAGGGLALDWFLVKHGIDLSFITSGISFGGVRMQPVVYGEITPGGVLWPILILAGVCLGAAVYPAFRAATVTPAVGMRET